MMRVRFTLIALCLVPAVAAAQMGRSGITSRTGEADARRARGEIDKENLPPLRLRVSDLEDYNPAHVIGDEKKALKLTDDQQAKLKELRKTIDQSNKELSVRFDSIRVAIRPTPNPSDEDRVREAIGREELTKVVQAIRANYTAAEPQALAVLDDTQKAAAKEILANQEKDFEKTLRDKMGGRSFGGAGGGRPGGRPPSGS